ncbi:putative ubiquitin-like activating enzyme [Syncephalastrum racemosum]|uniref:Ubiquitin-activating enzyme E1-like n=1 Tax=Syncephalastrum racemosum TaxID=13706 RepID=A0A1X2HLB6_SYNRA|nr:putative ubiquitin-like activating enzyme [Syncephalastrum racemosum]
MSRDVYNKRILGQVLYDKVASSRVLLVGAGGIGCELLKNLVLSGYKKIVVIDLDTIDISNLNRQFLFQKQHVKQSKAHVAKESALKFNPHVDITSHQANIKNADFDVAWFASFDLVFNALDNLEARRHVNQMCLAADVPLIESGTTGYLGQAYVIRKDETECFDCQPKPTPTTFPVCTIRSTPSAPIHCIVWAKSYLFSQLFGNSEDDFEDDASAENAQELAALAKETQALNEIKSAMGTDQYPRKVFQKVFKEDIERLLTMDDMWKFRERPTALDYDTMRQVDEENKVTTGLKDQQMWSLEQCFQVFKDSVVRLSERLMAAQKTNPSATLEFDKDDDDALDFVTATANLRAHIFKIMQKSRFEVKSMAGNIIPAIATTNAIIAGVVVMQSFAVLRGPAKSIKRTYLTTVSRRPQLLIQEAPSEPNPACGVCRATTAVVQINPDTAKLRDLVRIATDSADEGGAGMDPEAIAIMDGNRMIYDIDLEENLGMFLHELGVHDGSMLRVASDDDGAQLDLVIVHKTQDAAVRLEKPLPLPLIRKQPPPAGEKRGLDEEEEDSSPAKKAKTDNDVILVEEDQDGSILID